MAGVHEQEILVVAWAVLTNSMEQITSSQADSLLVQLVKKLPTFYGTRRFINVST
jgi:hypothetical protein